MALDFPTSPSNGDTHQASNGIQYIFDSSKSQWKSQGEFSSGAIEAKKIDDISGSFNGSTVTFTLNSGGSVVKPQNSQSVLITLNGLVQDPGTAYTTSITTGQITFTSAPSSGTSFIGVIYSRLPVSSSTTLSTTGGTMTGDIVFNSTQTFGIGGIQDGNTSQKGVVQLSTSTTSTSETLAATASAVKSVKDAIPSNLGDLSNVSSSSPSTNHVLKWSGSEWAPSAESGGGASTLGALTDVSSSTPGNGQVLKYNTASSQWEPGTDATGGGSGGTTNLGAVASGAALTITSSSGNDASVPAATTSSWGVMTDEMFDKLDGIAAGATANAGTVTGVTGTSPIASSGGATPAISITAASGSAAGSMSSAHYTKLEGIAASANNYAISTDLLDEDDLSTNSATKVASQQSIKAYVDAADALKANLASPALTGTATAVNLTLSGNLIVNGTTTTINSTTLAVDDKNIELGTVDTPSDTTADGGGITLKGATDKTITWTNATNTWDFNQNVNVNAANLNVINPANAGDARLFLKAGEAGTAYILFNADEGDNQSDNYRIYAPNGGPLSIQYDDGNWETSIECNQNGAVELYHDGTLQCKTASYGLDFADNKRADFGTDNDLVIYHDGSNGFITNTTGELTVSNSTNLLFSTASNERARIDSNGRLLLGAASTTGASFGSTPLAIFESSTTNDYGRLGLIYNGDDAHASALYFGKSRGTSDGSNTVVQADDQIGSLFFHGADGTDKQSRAVGITAFVDGTPGSNDMPGRLVFSTTPDGSTSCTERLRISSTGAIGIAGANYGTSGQVLTSGGSGSAPSWADASGGGGVSSDAQNNTVGGTNAGDSFTGTDATDNTLFGYNAGTAITTGDANSIFGKNSGLSISTGGRNVAVGNYCLGALTTGSQNVAIGEQCLSGDLTSGDDNIAIGNRAGYSVTGYGNVLLGYYAGYNVTSAHRCVIIGYEAGRTMTSGAHNILIGTDAGYNQTTPGTNLCIGRRAGMDITTSDGNILFGYNAGRSDSPSGSVTDESSYNTICLGNNSTTQLYCADTSISSSDSRDKTDVTNFTHGLSWINKLNPITYRWDKRTWYNEYNDDGSLKTAGTPDGSKKRERQHIGFLAQDVLEIEKADGFASKKDDMLIVNLNEDDTAYGLKYERLVPVLVNAIKELSAKVEALEAK